MKVMSFRTIDAAPVMTNARPTNYKNQTVPKVSGKDESCNIDISGGTFSKISSILFISANYIKLGGKASQVANANLLVQFVGQEEKEVL